MTHPKDLLISCFFCPPTVRQIIQFPSHFPQHPPGVGCGGKGGGWRGGREAATTNCCILWGGEPLAGVGQEVWGYELRTD